MGVLAMKYAIGRISGYDVVMPVSKEKQPLQLKDAAVVVRQMLKVAAECHLCGLVHRDMKPEVPRNKPDFHKRPWPSISPSAKDFIKRSLVKNPRARLTAAQALSRGLGLDPLMWAHNRMTVLSMVTLMETTGTTVVATLMATTTMLPSDFH